MRIRSVSALEEELKTFLKTDEDLQRILNFL